MGQVYSCHTTPVKLEPLDHWEALMRIVSAGFDYALEEIKCERAWVLNGEDRFVEVEEEEGEGEGSEF
jgi:hypothetical protein